jgi:hypothetical protein
MSSKRTDQFLNYCSLPLILRGVSLAHDVNRVLKIVRILLLGFGLISPFYHFFRIFFYRQWTVSVLPYIINDGLWWIIVIWTNLFFLIRRNKLIRFAKQCFRCLDEESSIKLRKLALILSLIALIFVALEFIAIVFVTTGKWVEHSYLEMFLIVNQILNYVTQDTVVVSATVYLCFFSLVMSGSNVCLKGMHQYLLLEKNPKLDRLHDIICSVSDSLQDFNDLFSVLPFLWLTNNFSAASAMVLYFLEDNVGSIRNYLFSMIFTVNNLYVIITLIIVSVKQKQLEKLSTEIQRLLAKTQTSEPVLLSSIISSLQSMSSTRMTVWPVFPLDTSLILSFMSNLMTFTVMFITLTR